MKLPTTLIHSGHFQDSSGAVMPPIILSTTFERGEDGLSFPSGYSYTRHDNPNRKALEEKLKVLEGGAEAIAFASGLTAALAIFQSLRPGDHVLIPDDVYFGVKSILAKLYAQWQLSYTGVDMSNLKQLAAAIQPNTRLIWIETPSNPLLKICDIEAIVSLAQSQKLITVCDNTWATPFFTRPLDWGVDISMHSTTKYMGGHSDLLGGAVVCRENDERCAFLRNFQQIGGAVPSPFDCWLLCRSLATFAVRMPIHAANAQALAEYLNKQSPIEKVLYPGLSSDPGHEIAQRQMLGGFGGMLSVLVKGGRETALKLSSSLKIFKHASSLGGVESLVEHRRSIESEDSLTPDNLLRISVGIEHVDDLIADFEQALKGL
ncbi:MAG TPA: aminotransferase class I/II-fold pyridoxal phosphate-dependent enzyme [Saprospiraceae bacterium]|nr:aminotransferase class I/II-fold pyridoxal phosphate-dependent enzyme [Saprospiraceae bacterium]HMQ84213.1 aminotransferase class I/II-fold pyridoxal phosphate-dependent enzyme [Saprospiraceae bacterium]